MTEVPYSTYVLMQTDEPKKVFRKTILANLSVEVLNPFTEKPEVVLLSGESNDPKSRIKLWTDKQISYFMKVNIRAIETGKLIEVTSKDKKLEELRMEPYAGASDDDLNKLLDSRKTPWYSLVSIVKSIALESVLYRLLEIARQQEKSQKVLDLITTRLSQVQGLSPEEDKNG